MRIESECPVVGCEGELQQTHAGQTCIGFPEGRVDRNENLIQFTCPACGEDFQLSARWYGMPKEQNQKREVIASFDGANIDHHFLSNFWECRLVMDDGIEYPSAEHAFQAQKTRDRAERERIAELGSPGQAKHAGRRVVLRSDWEEIKIEVMQDVVERKFKQNPELARALLATGDAELIEGNTWGDEFWGVCRGVGENHLGKILMQVRKGLQQGGEVLLAKQGIR